MSVLPGFVHVYVTLNVVGWLKLKKALPLRQSLETVYQEETALPETASKMTRLAERVDWNAWNMATITGEYDPGHSTVPRWRARGRAAIIRETAQRLGMDETFVRREAARRDFWGEAYERDVSLAELEPPDGCRTPPRVHCPIP